MLQNENDEQAVQAIIEAFECKLFRGINIYPKIGQHNISLFTQENLINCCIQNYHLQKTTQFLGYIQQQLITLNIYSHINRFTMMLINNEVHKLFLSSSENYQRWKPILENMLMIPCGQAYLLTGNNEGIPLLLYLLKYDHNFFKIFLHKKIRIREESYVFILCFYEKLSIHIQLTILNILQVDSVDNYHLLQIYQNLILKTSILTLNTDNQILELLQHYKYISKNGVQLNIAQDTVKYVENQLTLETFIQIFEKKLTLTIVLESLLIINKYQMSSLFKYLAKHDVIETALKMFNSSPFDIQYKIILIINYLYVRSKEQFIQYIEANNQIQQNLRKCFVRGDTFNIYTCIDIESIYNIIKQPPDIIKQYQLVPYHTDLSNNQFNIQLLIEQDYFKQKSHKYFLLNESLEILNIKHDQLQNVQDIFKLNTEFNKILNKQNIEQNQFLHMIYQINGIQSNFNLAFQFKLIKNFEIAHRSIYKLLINSKLIKKQFIIQKISLKDIFYPKIDETGSYNMIQFVKKCLSDNQTFQTIWKYFTFEKVNLEPTVDIAKSFLKKQNVSKKADVKQSSIQNESQNKFTVKQLIHFINKYLDESDQNYIQVKDLLFIEKNIECSQIKDHIYTQLPTQSKLCQLYNDINQVRLQTLKEYGKQTSYSPYNQNQKLMQSLENDIIISTELVHMIFNYLCFYFGLRGHLSNLGNYVPQSFTITDFNEVIYCENTSMIDEQHYISQQNMFSIMCVVKMFRYEIMNRISIINAFILMNLVQYVIEFETQDVQSDCVGYQNPILSYDRNQRLENLIQQWQGDIYNSKSQDNHYISSGFAGDNKNYVVDGDSQINYKSHLLPEMQQFILSSRNTHQVDI